MWYDYPERASFDVTISINIKAGRVGLQNKINLKYQQATISETISFLKEIEGDNIDTWLISFLKEHSDINKITLGFMKIDKKLTNTVFNTVKDSRFRGVFDSKKNAKSDGPGQPYNATIMFLCEKISIDPNKFQKNYTVEQMNYLIDGAIYNINAQTDKGQEENDRNMFNKTHNDEDLLQLIS